MGRLKNSSLLILSIVITLSMASCGTSQEHPTVEEPTVSYLEEVIPPCTPISNDGPDPCPSGTPPTVQPVGGQASFILRDPLPTMTERLTGFMPVEAAHLVIRGTATPDTTRCELYPIVVPNISSLDAGRRYDMAHYHCFVDFRINEYYIGEGPPELAVSIFRDSVLLSRSLTWDTIEEVTEEDMLYYFRDPQSRVADAYEGREMILFLIIPKSIAVEAWTAETVYFVQRRGEEIRLVSQSIRLARTPEQHNALNVEYTEFVSRLKEASVNRIALTGGRIGTDPSLPMLVTDANKLRDFYAAIGAFYEGDDATVLPPPVPGQDGPVQDSATTGEEGENEGDPTGLGEDTTTSSTDEATTTTSSTTTTTEPPTTTTTSTTAPSTTTTQPPTTTTAPSTTTTTVPDTTTTEPLTTTTTEPPTTTTTSTTVSSTTTTTAPTTTTTSTTAVTTTSPTTTSTTAPVATAPGSARGLTLEAGNGNITAHGKNHYPTAAQPSPATNWPTAKKEHQMETPQ